MHDAERLYREVLAGWNAQDGARMAAPFAADGWMVGFDGSIHAGRDEMAAQIQAIFDDHETGEYVAKVREVRELGGDVAVVRAVAGMVPAGATELKPELNVHHTLVAHRRDGRWQAVLLQNTQAQFHGRPHLVEEHTAELEAVRAGGA